MSMFLNRADENQAAIEAVIKAQKGRSLTDDAIMRFKRNKLAFGSLIVLIVLCILAVVFGVIQYLHDYHDYAFAWPYNTSKIFRSAYRLDPPLSPILDGFHIFGFDVNGRDLFVRTMQGLGKSLQVAFWATSIAVLVGIIYGAVAGYFGGRIDNIMMRFVDALFALPYILFIILLQVIFGRNEMLLYMAIGLLEWKIIARIVRGQTLSLKEKEFIEAAQASGRGSLQIILSHIIPNLLGPIIVFASLTVPEIILTESFLSFIGFGVQEPAASLGTLINEGKEQIGARGWMFLAPATVLVILLFALIFIGEGLRDAFDPKDR